MAYEALLTSLLYGFIEGSLYALLGVGLALALGVMKIVNLAHGAFAVLGAYLLISLSASLHLPLFITFLLSMALVGVIGLGAYIIVVDKVVVHELSTLVTTYGLELIIANLILSIYGGATLTYSLGLGTLSIGGVVVGFDRLLVTSIALASILSLHLFLKKTYLGRAMRAVADDIEAAGLMGINPKKIYAMSYAICALLGCLFGLSFVTTHYVNPMISGLLNLKAFVVTVLSGGNLVLALIAGITLGLCETTITSFVLPTAYQNIVPFTILLIALTILKRKRRL